MNLILHVLMFCLPQKFTGQSDVIGSHEPVHVTVGHDVILPCQLEPPYDVTTLTVEWRRNKSFVHIYRNSRDYLDDQDKNFRGRTSLFLDKLHDGNISLKLTNVTEQDEGNYTCFVPKLDSQVRRGFIQLRVDPEENRHKGNQTHSDHNTGEINNNRHRGFFALIIILAISATVVIIIRTRRVNNRGDGRGGHEPVEMSEMVNSRDEGGRHLSTEPNNPEEDSGGK